MKYLTLQMDDGSIYGIPVDVIARHRAANYADEFGGDIERSLAEDSLPLFEDDDYNVIDWAANNMDWSDVKDHAVQLQGPQPIDFDRAWIHTPKRVEEVAR